MACAPPNLIAYERSLLRCLGNTDFCRTGAPTVGLVAALECYGTMPFWKGVLSGLGLNVRMSQPRAADLESGLFSGTVLSANVCQPAKGAHGHALSLLLAGVDAVLMPVFRRGNHCPVSCGYAQVVAAGWDDLCRLAGRDPVALLTPEFSCPRPGPLAQDGGVEATLQQMVWQLGLPAPSESSVREALQAGLDAQHHFERVMESETQSVLSWLAADKERRGLLLAGRPYHTDPSLGLGYDELAADSGFAVLSLAGLRQALGEAADRMRRTQQGAYPWKQAKRLVKAAHFVAAQPQMEMACTLSFGCAFDALSVEEARTVLKDAARTLVVLPADDTAGVAQARVRLRTLASASRFRQLRPTERRSAPKISSPPDVPSASWGCDAARISPSATSPSPRAVDFWSLAAEVNRRQSERLAASLPDGLCTVVSSVASIVARAYEEGRISRNDTVELPDLCEQCLLEAVPHLAEELSGAQPSYRWAQEGVCAAVTRAMGAHAPGDVFARCYGAGEGALIGAANGPEPDGAVGRELDGSATNGSKPSDAAAVGVLGNPLLLADGELVGMLARTAARFGRILVPPDPRLLKGEDIAYPDQLARFRCAGVREVLYLLPGGCCKAHGSIYGARSRLERRFCGMRIHVLELDERASSLNFANRLALALSRSVKTPSRDPYDVA